MRVQLAALTASLALAAPASAAHDLRDVPPAVRDGPAVTSAGGHFLVHYTTDAGSPDATTADGAAHLGDVLEAAYARETGEWGWPAPVDDGDGKADVYVFSEAGIEGSANYDAGPRPVAGWLQFAAQESDTVIAHELLHLLQFAMPGSPTAPFLGEGTAHWAGNRFAGDRGALVSVPLWANANYLGTPLDCPATSPCHNNAGPATAGWAFFEYLAERYGPAIVADVYRRGQAQDGSPPGDTRAVADALASRGTDLGTVFAGYAIATAAGTWKLSPLSLYYPRPAAELSARRIGQRLAATPVTLDHLAQAAVYGQVGCSRCNLALRLNVSWPAGLTGVAPAWVRHDLGLVRRLKVSGNSATGVVPLDGTPTPAMLILANPSASLDGARFTVSATVLRGLPPVVRIVSATVARRGARVLKLQLLMSASGLLRVRLGTFRQTRFAGAGASSGDIFVPRSLHGTVKLKVTPVDDRGHKGRTVSARVTL